ncbi:TVP38/TMEM64 family protein [Halosimplex litoreum]|uniref:TVP38/TMEM64 family protein n=1 Tax=Halosimplex litoreum TaxID=1198301 RepID=A0A7T3KVP4_9EURY|nr:VTT domain-containing protein [Halosimplex litoreum]QPV63507.1 TVP38/TMEM64 family protein [Halosimplex litoreum]
MAVSRATRRQLAGLGALALALAAGAVVFSPAAVLESLVALSGDPWRFLAVLVVLYVVRPFVLWPVSLLSLTVGYVYGAAVGIPIAAAGVAVSTAPPFLLARRFRTDEGVLGRTAGVGDRIVTATGGFRGLVAARLAPIPSDVTSSAAGLSDLSPRTYLAGTLVGETPWIVGAVVAGASMHTLSVDGLDQGIALVAAATAVSGLLLAGPTYRLVRERYDLGVDAR